MCKYFFLGALKQAELIKSAHNYYVLFLFIHNVSFPSVPLMLL